MMMMFMCFCTSLRNLRHDDSAFMAVLAAATPRVAAAAPRTTEEHQVEQVLVPPEAEEAPAERPCLGERAAGGFSTPALCRSVHGTC